jgi:hypothetical protein
MVEFYYANDGKHKLIAKFNNPNEIIKFGAYDYNDYTIYYQMDPELAKKRKTAYLKRHKANEDWTNPRTAGTLSKYILWNKPTIEESINSYKKKFNL